MKKHILIALALIMIVFPILSGCSVIGKLSENGIKTSDGEIIVGDNVKWPEKNMAGLAKPNAELTAVLKDDTTGSYTVAFANMSKENAVQYVAKLKELGYQAILEFSDTDAVMFSGKNSSGVVVTFTYNITAKKAQFLMCRIQRRVPCRPMVRKVLHRLIVQTLAVRKPVVRKLVVHRLVARPPAVRVLT